MSGLGIALASKPDVRTAVNEVESGGNSPLLYAMSQVRSRMQGVKR